jgi:hypothetical protein
LDEQLQPMHTQFQKKDFYSNFKMTLILSITADKAGFSSREDIKNILNYLQIQNIAQLYLQEEIDKRINISEKDAKKECRELKKTNPKYKQISPERCITFARGKLKNEKMKKLLPDLLVRIKEGISIKHNDKFDLEQYLNSKIDFNQ